MIPKQNNASFPMLLQYKLETQCTKTAFNEMLNCYLVMTCLFSSQHKNANELLLYSISYLSTHMWCIILPVAV